MRVGVVVGGVLFLIGVALAFVPIYAPAGPGAEMQMIETLWFVGLPIACAGLALAVVSFLRRS